jgi:hypothetical protein
MRSNAAKMRFTCTCSTRKTQIRIWRPHDDRWLVWRGSKSNLQRSGRTNEHWFDSSNAIIEWSISFYKERIHRVVKCSCGWFLVVHLMTIVRFQRQRPLSPHCQWANISSTTATIAPQKEVFRQQLFIVWQRDCQIIVRSRYAFEDCRTLNDQSQCNWENIVIHRFSEDMEANQTVNARCWCDSLTGIVI